MLKTVEGIYNNGKIELKEIPKNIPQTTKFIVIFLEIPDNNISNNFPSNDLDYLAGRWSEDDEIDFINNTQEFTKIDVQLWQ